MKLANTVILCIFDGFGIGKRNNTNAIFEAKTSTFDYLFSHYPYHSIQASGKYVGLPDNQMGNSEVGHLTLGIGRIEKQSLTLINDEITTKKFFRNKVIINAIEHAKNQDSVVHLLGMASYGGVHSHINHLYALIKMCNDYGVKCCIDCILDGRDTQKNIGLSNIKELQKIINSYKNPNIYIGTISGRYYAMDRDKRWDRIELAIDALFSDSKSKKFDNPVDYIQSSYNANIFDEFVLPAFNNTKDCKIKNKDVIIMYNFRQDRAIQLASCLSNPNYIYKPKHFIDNLNVVTMRKYSESVYAKVCYPYHKINNTFGQYVSQLGYSQLRLAETEKYAHVTYFFDGGENIEFKNEKRILIPSPKVKTYDLAPKMSAEKITDELIKNINKYDFIIMNYANCDMVGHTGNFKKTIEAINFMDQCIKRIYNNVIKNDSLLIITADHGNAELMKDNDGNTVKKHTNNLIPLCFISKNNNLKFDVPKNYIPSLQDVVPSIFSILNIKIPSEMQGIPLLKLRRNND